MICRYCENPLSPVEITDNTGLCMRCELIELRKYKKREADDLLKLKGGPVWNKYVVGKLVHGADVVLNFT